MLIHRPPQRLELLALTLLFSIAADAHAGKLSEVRSEVRHEAKADDSGDRGDSGLSAVREEVRSDDPPRRKRRSRFLDDVCPVAPIVVYGAVDSDTPAMPQPLTRPHVVDPEHPAIIVDPLPQPICRFPFCGGFEGYRIDKPWAARMSLDHGLRTEGIQRNGFGLLIESEHRLGLQFDWNRYSERLRSGRHDDLQFGAMNVLVRVIDEPSAQFRLGLGVNWLHDRIGTDAGLNLTAAADVFPVKPFVLSGQLDVGAIGDTSTFHTRVTAGVLWKRLEFFGGYDYRTFGSVSLHGPLLGLRIWF